ncbi:MAG: M48 family metalloprotease [Deltaproteobacteria bacterium]|jgi:putative metalloprotease|nr:M48 family metalloprotease [Deltaproteobacteria bacterium]
MNQPLSFSRQGRVILPLPGGPMFKPFAWIAVIFLIPALFGGCVNSQHLSAAGDLYSAATISNDEIIALCKQMREQGDKANKVAAAKDKYAVRLARLTNRFKKEDGLDLNFKVYLTTDVNANATADGSVRVYSGLMDLMTDNELIFVIGHEIGHVAGGDSLDKVRVAYASSGAIKAASASGKAGAALSSTQLGDLLNAVINAQFSQNQESEADAYGYKLMKKYKLDTKAGVSALQKLGGGGTELLSSHPGSADRAKAIQAMIDADKKK